MAFNPARTKSRFEDLENKIAKIEEATKETKTTTGEIKPKVESVASGINSIPENLAGSNLFKGAIEEAVRSSIGSGVSDAKTAAEAAKAAAEATKTAVDNIPRDITLPPDVIQALKEVIRDTVRSEITAQGIDDSAIRTAVAEMRQAVDALRLNAGAFDVKKILDVLAAMDERLSRIEGDAHLGAFVPDAAKQGLINAYAPFKEAKAIPG